MQPPSHPSPRSSQSDPPALRPIQEKVLALLIEGVTVTDAAQATGIHRTTIHHWCRHLPLFHAALTNGRASRSAQIRDTVDPLADTAVEALRGLLTSPETPASVRLHAIQHVLAIANTPEPATPRKTSIEEMYALERFLDRANLDPQQAAARDPLNRIHQNSSQNDVSRNDESESSGAAADGGRPVARSAPCPCGNGRKYKRCCGTGSPPAQSARTAA